MNNVLPVNADLKAKFYRRSWRTAVHNLPLNLLLNIKKTDKNSQALLRTKISYLNVNRNQSILKNNTF